MQRLAAGQEAAQDTVSIADMGTHMLRGLPGLHLVVQVLVPGLEERARILPPLTSSFNTPGAEWGWAVRQGGPGCVLHLHKSASAALWLAMHCFTAQVRLTAFSACRACGLVGWRQHSSAHAHQLQPWLSGLRHSSQAGM